MRSHFMWRTLYVLYIHVVVYIVAISVLFQVYSNSCSSSALFLAVPVRFQLDLQYQVSNVHIC
jgi:hypothetical protein